MDKLTNDGIMDAEHVAKACVRRENASSAVAALHVEIARGGGSNRPPHLCCFFVFFHSYHRRGHREPLC